MTTRVQASSFLRWSMFVLLLAALAGAGWGIFAIVSAQNRLSWLATLQATAERYVSSLKDVETAYRGYAIVGEEDFLEPYRSAEADLGRNATALLDAAGNAGLSPAIAERMTAKGQSILGFGGEIIDARRRSFEEARNLAATKRGKAIMDSVRADLNEIQGWIDGNVQMLSERTRQVYAPLAGLALLIAVGAAGTLLYQARRAQAASVRTRALLADVIERAPVGLALIDGDLRISQINRMLSALAPNGLAVGQPLRAALPAIGQRLEERAALAVARRKGWADESAEDVLEAEQAGTMRYYKADVFPVLLPAEGGGERPGAGIVLSDMTRQREWEMELEEAKDEAEAANRAKSAFLANMSHELRTPLSAVLGYCELIEEDLRDLGEERVLTDLNKIALNAKHLLQLINDVLDLSKIEARKMDVHVEEFSLSKLFTEIEAATGSLIAKQSNALVIDSGQNNRVLVTDDLKLKQILLNLIGNAAKFTTNGTIALKAETTDMNGTLHARFTVTDTGIGMSAEQLSHLFQRFTQADQSTTRKYGGTGLGLALSRALTIMLGGTIEVDSKQGEGTRFTVTIPERYEKPTLEAEPVEDIAEPLAPRASRPDHAPVLIVDDDPQARELLSRHLAKEGFAIESATNGKEALTALAKHRPLAVLLDVLMPGMDGWRVLKEIRANPGTADIPVFMQTVLDDENFSYALGATGHLKKPVKRKDIAEALRGIVREDAADDIIVLDDDVGASSRLKRLLAKDGWEVKLIASAEDALKAVSERRPKLILVDLVMPGMDGYAFIRKLKENPLNRDIPLIVMTGEDIRSPRVRSLKKDTAGIIQKGSTTMAELVADLRRFADGESSQAKPESTSAH
jgi:signal transduction histidine kinase/CheY-like chemotaxis protein